MDTITVECALTALAVWEHLLERNDEEIDPELYEFWDKIGTAEMRVHALTIADWVDKVYDLMPEDERVNYCFDWEIVKIAVDQIPWDSDDLVLPDAQKTANEITYLLKEDNEP
jgi:hypothetical protein